jgi:hypothetical protein
MIVSLHIAISIWKQRKVLLTGEKERFRIGMNIPTINRRLRYLYKAKHNAQDPWFKDYWQKVINYMEELKRKQMH